MFPARVLLVRFYKRIKSRRPHNVAGHITSILFRGTKSMIILAGTLPKNSKAFW